LDQSKGKGIESNETRYLQYMDWSLIKSDTLTVNPGDLQIDDNVLELE